MFVRTDNPTLLATYDWTTTDLAPRTVDLFISNMTLFIIFNWTTGQSIELFPNEFTPGSGEMSVVPGPASWLLISRPLVAGRRRRC